jgi:hypothetical protein
MRSHREIDSARLFVQGFYDWYVPLAHKENRDSSWNVAIKAKPALFSRKLLTALREDAAAQDKETEYVVGLDFDPFLCSQDPADHYNAGKFLPQGDGYRVEVDNTGDGIKSDSPSLIAEIARTNKTWIFVNFYCSSGSDLLSVLSTLKAQREGEKQ